MSTLSAVYHKPPETFVSRQRLAVAKAEELQVRGPAIDPLQDECYGGCLEAAGLEEQRGFSAAFSECLCYPVAAFHDHDCWC
jgi:hypothetical protein